MVVSRKTPTTPAEVKALYEDLKRLKTRPDAAVWWQYANPELVLDPHTDEVTGVVLKCLLCDHSLSALREGSFGRDHIKQGHGTCKGFKNLVLKASVINEFQHAAPGSRV